jgi:hypothetical protein
VVLVGGLLGYFVLQYPLPENILPTATNFAASTLQDCGSGKNVNESLNENIRSSARAVGEQIKAQQNAKALKRMLDRHSLINLTQVESKRNQQRP